MATPPGDRAFVRLYLDVDQWKSNKDSMVCLACASASGVRQGARASGNRLPVWACSACQARLARLKRKGEKK
jgi:DNA-binding IclR family transcriptional regulator